MPVAYVVAFVFAVAVALCAVVGRAGSRFLRGRIGGVEPGIERRPPRLGGLAIFAAAFGVAALAGYPLPPGWGPLLPWILGMYALGFADDLLDVPPRVKFLGQAVICLAVTAHVSFSPIATPGGTGISLGPLAVPWTAFWLLLVINAVNFMDGADGLAGGFLFLVSTAIAFLAHERGNPELALWLAVFAAAHGGFLLVNWHPARIYLGDSGSLGAGFVLALAGIHGANAPGATVGLHTNALLFWLPLTEMALTVGRRFVRGQALSRGDERHVHHMLVVTGRRKDHAVALLLLLVALTAAAATFSARWRILPVAILVVGLVVVTFAGVHALGYVEFSVVRDRLGRLFRMTHRRNRTLVRVAEASQRLRNAGSWLELQEALRALVAEGILDRAEILPRSPGPEAQPTLAWTLEGDLGGAERPGYTLFVRSSKEDQAALRPDDVRNYLLPALAAAVERLGVLPEAATFVEKRNAP